MSLDFTQLLINTRNKTLDTLCCFLEHLRSNIVYMSIIVRQLVAHLVPSLATGWRKRRQQHTGFRKDREREREREWKGWGEGKHECRVSVQTRPCSLVPPSPSSSPSLVAFSPSSRGAREYESATPASLHNTYTGHRKRERERERESHLERTRAPCTFYSRALALWYRPGEIRHALVSFVENFWISPAAWETGVPLLLSLLLDQLRILICIHSRMRR